ncbi:MAG: bifunctional precorrin-2 dehydrogenase/sirohydrochlorin ferrochelatase [Nitrospinae bacterium]|nr:bifunctional precorrin-2 dehydrogenase/sirohydrochlorin ferrochelatase [Nitrospinota bacterium]
MSRYYPVFLDILGKKCVIVGAGQVAARKAASLVECGAMVTIVAPAAGEAMAEMIKTGQVEWLQAPFAPEYLNGAALVIASTDDDMVNRSVYKEASERGIPVNVVDQPELCTFIVPSVVKRGDLTIAASTSGKSPAVAKRVRRALEKVFGDEWGVYLSMMGEAREILLSREADQRKREEVFNRLADSAMLDKIKSGDLAGARRVMEEILTQ